MIHLAKGKNEHQNNRKTRNNKGYNIYLNGIKINATSLRAHIMHVF